MSLQIPLLESLSVQHNTNPYDPIIEQEAVRRRGILNNTANNRQYIIQTISCCLGPITWPVFCCIILPLCSFHLMYRVSNAWCGCLDDRQIRCLDSTMCCKLLSFSYCECESPPKVAWDLYGLVLTPPAPCNSDFCTGEDNNKYLLPPERMEMGSPYPIIFEERNKYIASEIRKLNIPKPLQNLVIEYAKEEQVK